MTAREVIAELAAMKDGGDTEAQHANADRLLVDFLIDAGYEDVARAFEAARERCGFWYA